MKPARWAALCRVCGKQPPKKRCDLPECARAICLGCCISKNGKEACSRAHLQAALRRPARARIREAM
jgi:hypothetical protein